MENLFNFEEFLEKCRPYINDGKVASYIPELAKSDKNKLLFIGEDGTQNT